jgi:EpsI family protein
LFKFLRSSAVIAASVLIVAQGVMLYSAVRPEAIPAGLPLSQLPNMLGSWQFALEGYVDQETRDVLKADDLLNRVYSNNGRDVYLFVAAFRSQRNGKAPHSPKNCLPGSGWTPLASSDYTFDPGNGTPITVNKYIVAHGDDRSLVLYWYQSRERVIASEYRAKFFVVMDAMRLNRTDTALVRVVVPIRNRDEEEATKVSVDFVRSFYQPLRQQLPM